MSLETGSRIGAYEVRGLLGVGGMGEVYRAWDPKLKREVALKILPDTFARDPGRMARFQREAELLASLNHSGIAHVYGVEENAFVMELVEGESPHGPMPLNDAWPIALQIVRALEYAHDRGVIHRDLKPANIRVTPDGVVKLLDFGLAKAIENPASTAVDIADSPTITFGATVAGTIMGTAAYMAPEQAKGKSVDKRADIWSFGVVLYELLTGIQPFAGEDAADTLAHVLTREPDLGNVPAAIRPLLRRCLEKDPKKRLRDIGEAPYLVDESRATAAPSSRRSPGSWVSLAVAAAAVAVAAALAFVHFRESPPVAAPVRFHIAAPEGRTFGTMSLSPDGRMLAFTANDKDNRGTLWVHFFETGDSRQLAPVQVGGAPFWSPDSRFVAFPSDGAVRRADINGGPVQTVCNLPAGIAWGAGTWNREDTIVFGSQSGPLYKVRAQGGVPVAITALNADRQELGHHAPSFLPDGHHLVYLRRSRVASQSAAFVGSLDVKPEEQSLTPLVATVLNPAFVASRSSKIGSLFFTRGTTVFVQPFDSERLVLLDEAIPVADNVATSGTSYLAITASTDGALAFRLSADMPVSRLAFRDRKGTLLEFVTPPGPYRDLALSPDGTRVAVDEADTSNVSDVHALDFARGTNQRLTTSPQTERTAVWSPDGKRIVFSSGEGPGALMNLFLKNASGSGVEQPLVSSAGSKFASSWSKQGYLLFSALTPPTRSDLWYVSVDGDRTPKPYLVTPFTESQGQFSPDGKWVAYTSDESGSNQVYVDSFPSPESRSLISNGGGFAPRWSADGKELFYLSPELNMMSVAITTSPAFSAGISRLLFPTKIWGGMGLNGLRWDVTPDGRFLLAEALENVDAQPITVVLNWKPGIRSN